MKFLLFYQVLILTLFQIFLFSVSQSDLPQEEPGLVAVAEHHLLQPEPACHAQVVHVDCCQGHHHKMVTLSDAV